MELMVKILADYTMLPVVGIAGVVFMLGFRKSDWYDRYVRVFMAGVSSYFLAKLAALIWQPTGLRPFEEQGVDPGASYLNNPGFPSDHALFATFLTLAVWYVTKNVWLTAIMALLTTGMVIGRVLALVHTPLDVVGGIAIALIGGLWYFAYGKRK